MAILSPDILEGSDPGYDELAVDTNPRPGEAHLRMKSTSKELKKLDKLERKKNVAVQASENARGYDEDLLQKASMKNRKFQHYRESLFLKHPELDVDISRDRDIDVGAPGKVGKVLGIPTMMAAAAMRMLMDPRSGYYEGIEKLNGGKLDHRFETRWAQNGGIPFLTFDTTIDDMQTTLRYLNKEAHALYEDPVFIHRKLIVDRARQLLMGQAPEAALYIKDANGQLETIVTRADVGLDRNGRIDPQFTAKGSDEIGTLKLRGREDIHTEIEGINADQAKTIMSGKQVDHIAITDAEKRIKYMLTKTRVKHARKVSPFIINGGLGAAVTIGIGPHSETMERTIAAIDAGAVLVELETAHAYRRGVIRKFQDLMLTGMAYGKLKEQEIEEIKEQKNFLRRMIKDIRKKYRDIPLILGYGTVISPEAVELLQALGIDLVKIGIGGGGKCSTFDVTGVGGLPPGHFIRCGRRAKALGIQIMADGGFNSRRRFSTISLLDGVALEQSGSWPALTVDSASLPIWDGEQYVKHVFGEASSPAVKYRREIRGTYDSFDDEEDLHSEGKSEHQPMATGRNATVGGIITNVVDAQKSDYSYSDARNTEEAQASGRVYRITPTKTNPF